MSLLTPLNSLLAATLLPLLGCLLLLFFGRRFGRQGGAAGPVSLGFAIGSFALALLALVRWVDQSHYVDAFTYPWIMLPSPPADPFHPLAAQAITVGCLVDSLTIVMFVILTLLAVLVQLFALGSITHERPRFFALFQLLQFAMLALLLSNTLLQMFIFWSLLSLATYFLIRHAAADAARRPALAIFLMYLLGDVAFLLGVGILLLHTHSFNGLALYDAHGTSVLADTASQTLGVRPSEYIPSPGAGYLDMHWLTWMGICILVAALTRMAQFPVHSWAARAAEAPAPVSATLLGGVSLAAGVYLLARVYPLLTLDARLIAAILGSVTLAAACLVALVQTDLRKLLAWLAVSQGGYTLLFLGVGGYTAGILHLFTQALVTTALFLAAGSILHGLGVADIRQMGGLWKRFPITAAASLFCVLAVAGAPWLSDSYSTNLGLTSALSYANALRSATGNTLYLWLLFRIPAIATYLTAFAVGRWWWLIFAGPNRNAKLLEAAHESAFLTLPVIILAGFSVGFWFEFSGIQPLIAKSIPAVLLPPDGRPLVIRAIDFASDPSYPRVIRDTGWAFLGLAAAVALYFNGLSLATRLRRLPGINIIDYWLRQGMFFDELFEGLLHLFIPLIAAVKLIERLLLILLRLTLWTLSLPAVLVALIERPRRKPADPTPVPPPKPESP